MKDILAVVIAMVSAVLGGMVTGQRHQRVRWSLLLGSVAVGALVAEAISLWWGGPPPTPLIPALDGLGLGLVVGWLVGRRPRGPRGTG
jgi:CHASE2 domain-containing sensor protein